MAFTTVNPYTVGASSSIDYLIRNWNTQPRKIRSVQLGRSFDVKLIDFINVWHIGVFSWRCVTLCRLWVCTDHLLNLFLHLFDLGLKFFSAGFLVIFQPQEHLVAVVIDSRNFFSNLLF